MKRIVKAGFLMIGMLAALVACGGGGGGSGTAVPTVSGTASEGALITGKTVKLKDANGSSAVDTTTNTTTGRYSIDVTGLTAPFLVTVTGTNGTYISLAQTAGTANINPITSEVVALAAGTSDLSGLFTNLTPAQLTAINANYVAKSALVTASLQAALPAGVTAANYFTGTITPGTGIDALFDTYQIAIDPAAGITVKTKDASPITVLTIPVATITANTTQPLPKINILPVANAGTAQIAVLGNLVTLDGSASSDANGDTLTYSWEMASKPAGSSATLSSTTAVKPAFTPDVVGTYVFKLIVNDGKANSAAATVTVTATTATIAVVDVALTQDAINKINATPSPKLVTLGFHILNDIPVSTTTAPTLIQYLPGTITNGQVNNTNYTIQWLSTTNYVNGIDVSGEIVSAGQSLFRVTYTLVTGVPQFSIDPTTTLPNAIQASTWLAGGNGTYVTLVPADFKLTVTYQ